MAEITGITPQVKDKTRCNVEVDGRFYCGMKLETVMQNRLKVGMTVEKEYLAVLQLESEKKTALDKALRHISVSMKTEKQIREYLTKKGYLSEISDYVIEKMREYHYINDEEYAKMYSETAGKRKGKRLIAVELKRKGVSDAVIETALTSITGEKESAERVLEKYMRGKTVDKKTLSKAYAYLLGKGYDYDTAKSALQSVKDVEDETNFD